MQKMIQYIVVNFIRIKKSVQRIAIFDKNEKLKSFNNQNNCVINSITVIKIILINDAKTTLDKNTNIYNIKARDIYEKSLKQLIKEKTEKYLMMIMIQIV